MKTLIFINGPMGVGKSAVCRELLELLRPGAYLDGDWCWMTRPFVVTEETKAMVMDNICHVLNNFIHCTEYENIIFCWVMHQQGIIDSILERLDTGSCSIKAVSLVCSEGELQKRLDRDIEQGLREADAVERSIPRLALYEELDTVKLDVSELTVSETAERLAKMGEV